MIIEPVELTGEHVRLEPLAQQHLPQLAEAITDGELWKLFVTLVPKPEQLDAFLERALKDQSSGDGLTFATIDKASGRVVGSTRFMKSNLAYKRTEIGYTFIAAAYQRTVINTEAKLLMLTYAFESLDLNRVEFMTDFLNTKSRQAIARLGAKEEGVLRNHFVMPNGRIRDSVIFSIIANEWAGVKENLEFKLQANTQ